MLFVRRWGGVNGGQIKVSDYAKHVAGSGLFEPWLFLAPESTPLDPSLAFAGLRRADDPDAADAYFLAGLDWRVLDAAGVRIGDRPVVNLIQGFGHADLGDPKHAYLERPALRICVSPAVAAEIDATGRANGPMVTIENGIDVAIATRPLERARRVVIAGEKNASVALEVASALEARGVPVEVLTATIARDAFLDALAGASVAVVLPHEREGFFLPALEAMALGCAVVVPDCEGTRTFCIDGQSASVCAYAAGAIADAALRVWDDPALAARLTAGGRVQAERHSLARERAQFVDALEAYVGRRGVPA